MNAFVDVLVGETIVLVLVAIACLTAWFVREVGK